MNKAEQQRIYNGIAVDGNVSALELAKSSEDAVNTLTEIFSAIKHELASKDLFIQCDARVERALILTESWLECTSA